MAGAARCPDSPKVPMVMLPHLFPSERQFQWVHGSDSGEFFSHERFHVGPARG
jgi:hypothetical protein